MMKTEISLFENSYINMIIRAWDAFEELKQAHQNFELADPDFIDIAITDISVAKEKIDILEKQIKVEEIKMTIDQMIRLQLLSEQVRERSKSKR